MAGNMYVSFTLDEHQLNDAGGFIQAEPDNFTVGTGLSDDTEASIMCLTYKNPYTSDSCWSWNHTVSNPNCTNNHTLPFVNEEMDVHNGYHPKLSGINSVSGKEVNISLYNFPNEIWMRHPDWEIAVKVAAFIPFVLVGLFGNGLIIKVVVCNRAVRTPTNMLLANMAAADLATLLLCPVMFICTDSFQNYILDELGCKVEGFFNCSFLLTAVLNLTAVSYDRLTAIVLPQDARLSHQGTRIVMVATWVVGMVFSSPLIIYRTYKERQWFNFLERYCTENVTVLPTYWHVIILLIVWLPLATMMVCYLAIFVKLDQYEQQVLRRQNLVVAKYKTRVARILFIVLLVFIVCRIPYTGLIFRRAQLLENNNMNQVDDNFRNLWFASRYLLFINAAINPIIYGFTNENFRRAIRVMGFSRWLFGTSSSSEVTPRPPRHIRMHTHEAYSKTHRVKDKEPQRWFSHPQHKVRTLSTECYM